MPMRNAELILKLPCGCRHNLYAGDVIGIPFQRLPLAVAEVIERLEKRGCQCPAIQHS